MEKYAFMIHGISEWRDPVVKDGLECLRENDKIVGRGSVYSVRTAEEYIKPVGGFEGITPMSSHIRLWWRSSHSD